MNAAIPLARWTGIAIATLWCGLVAPARAQIIASIDSARTGVIRWTPTMLVSGQDSTAAEMGRLRVPERHAHPDGTVIELAFVRLRSTSAHPGAPIVYLAGGPGSSGIGAARGSRYPLFLAMRALGDVIALDQRGVGESRPKLDCPERLSMPHDRPWTSSEYARTLEPLAHHCADRLRGEGIDLDAYNTNESADDLESLRIALGVPRLRLWAISYGTHLALATIRRHPDRVERAILAGVEGPDHTDKLPSNTQRLLERISALAAHDSTLRPMLHGQTLIAIVERTLARLERTPAQVRVVTPKGRDTVEVVVGREELQVTLADLLGGAETQPYFPAFVLAADRGDFSLLVRIELAAGVRHDSSIGNAMSYAMDCASGATAARGTRIAREAPTTTLGNATNLDLACEAWNVRPLDDAFRSPVHARTPVLFISGTQDLNTPPSNAEEVRRGFPNSAHLVIEGVAHSDPLFLSSPRIRELMQRFMRGEPVPDTRIAVPFQFRTDPSELERYLR